MISRVWSKTVNGKTTETSESLIRVRVKGPWRCFMQISGEGWDELGERLADHTLGMQAMRVLFAMMSSMDKENGVRAGRKDLARKLKMDEANVSKAIRLLVECGFVEPPKLKFDRYVVSPRFAWSSTMPNLRQALRERGMLDSHGMMTA